jgi:hypothetical protein
MQRLSSYRQSATSEHNYKQKYLAQECKNKYEGTDFHNSGRVTKISTRHTRHSESLTFPQHISNVMLSPQLAVRHIFSVMGFPSPYPRWSVLCKQSSTILSLSLSLCSQRVSDSQMIHHQQQKKQRQGS